MTDAAIISLYISLLGIAVLALWLWPDYCVDRLRQDLFALRDDLFDMAAARTDGVTFSSPAYQQLRTTINGAIRFAPRVDLLGLVLFGAAEVRDRSEQGPEFEEKWQRNVALLSAPAASRLQAIRHELHSKVAIFSLVSSPHLVAVGMPVVIAVVAVIVGRTFLTRTFPARVVAFKQRLRSAYDAAAFDEGCLA